MYLDVKVPEIVLVRNGADPGDPIAGQLKLDAPSGERVWVVTRTVRP